MEAVERARQARQLSEMQKQLAQELFLQANQILTRSAKRLERSNNRKNAVVDLPLSSSGHHA